MILGITTIGCGGAVESSEEEYIDTTSSVGAGISSMSDITTHNSDYLFDQTQLRSYRLLISDADLKKLDDDPMAEEYVSGSLVFEGDTVDNIGIRYKGAIGSFWGCVGTNNGWPVKGLKKTCPKLSMKIKINYLGDRKFNGVKKLQFHNLNNSASLMNERLEYWLFREMDVITSRAVHAKLYINDTFNGLFTLVEQIDGSFTNHHFDDGSGNLYKEIWPISWKGKAFSSREYQDALKTNEESSDLAMIQSFGNEFETAAESEFGALFAKWTNVEYMMAYAAVDRATWNNDGVFHWWGGTTTHNFYWYENPTTQQMVLIPWDMDLAFSKQAEHMIDDWGVVSNDCEAYTGKNASTSQRSAACDNIVKGWIEYDAEYKSAQEKLLNGPMAQAKGMIDIWADQISGAVKEAYTIHADEKKALSVENFNEGIDDLKDMIDESIEKLKSDIQ